MAIPSPGVDGRFIIMLSGPPGAGKTTLAHRLSKQLDKESEILSSDEFSSPRYVKLLGCVEEKIADYDYLILDATFYRLEWREKLREIVTGRARLITVFIDCSLETCLRRNRLRDDPIPEKAVHIIWREFDRPGSPDIHIDPGELDVESAVNEIMSYIRRIEDQSKI